MADLLGDLSQNWRRYLFRVVMVVVGLAVVFFLNARGDGGVSGGAEVTYKPPTIPIQVGLTFEGKPFIRLSDEVVTAWGAIGISSTGTYDSDDLPDTNEGEWVVVVHVSGERQASTYRFSADTELDVIGRDSEKVRVIVRPERQEIAITFVGAGFVEINDRIVSEESGTDDESPGTSLPEPAECPRFADTQRARVPAGTVVIEEWFNDTIQVLVCEAPNGSHFYYGRDQEIEGGADILLDADLTDVSLVASNKGATTYTLDRSTGILSIGPVPSATIYLEKSVVG